jgi:pimeloyl-ACP methyl ester carboxylesterase
MGITSIDLIRLKRNIEEQLELSSPIPIITLMTNPTIRSLVIALNTETIPKYEPVVVIQPNGTKTPLWLVHPGVGEVLVFLNLAKYLPERPVYAFRARGFNKGESYFVDIRDAVTTYLAAIKRKQPKGPYALAGYSYGSMLAYETAKMLESNGDQVSFLGVFNLPPHIKSRMRQLSWVECILHLSYFWSSSLRSTLGNWLLSFMGLLARKSLQLCSQARIPTAWRSFLLPLSHW